VERKQSKLSKKSKAQRSGLLKKSISKEVILEEDSQIKGSYASALSLECSSNLSQGDSAIYQHTKSKVGARLAQMQIVLVDF
jgi:hypothetical protein